MSQLLKIFGHATSQPTRAVLWLCMMKKLPYDFVKVDPTVRANKEPAFVKQFPAGIIPSIEDGAVRISEAHAIMTYLATKHVWHDVYPLDVGEVRAFGCVRDRVRRRRFLH